MFPLIQMQILVAMQIVFRCNDDVMQGEFNENKKAEDQRFSVHVFVWLRIITLRLSEIKQSGRAESQNSFFFKNSLLTLCMFSIFISNVKRFCECIDFGLNHLYY